MTTPTPSIATVLGVMLPVILCCIGDECGGYLVDLNQRSKFRLLTDCDTVVQLITVKNTLWKRLFTADGDGVDTTREGHPRVTS